MNLLILLLGMCWGPLRPRIIFVSRLRKGATSLGYFYNGGDLKLMAVRRLQYRLS